MDATQQWSSERAEGTRRNRHGGCACPVCLCFRCTRAENTHWEGQLDEVYLSQGYDLGSQGVYPQR